MRFESIFSFALVASIITATVAVPAHAGESTYQKYVKEDDALWELNFELSKAKILKNKAYVDITESLFGTLTGGAMAGYFFFAPENIKDEWVFPTKRALFGFGSTIVILSILNVSDKVHFVFEDKKEIELLRKEISKRLRDLQVLKAAAKDNSLP